MKPLLILGILTMACSGETEVRKKPASLSCPDHVSESTVMKPGYLKYGQLKGLKILYETILVTGGLIDTVNWYWAEDPIDEWDATPEGDRSVANYEGVNHDGMSLRCDYFPKGKYDGRSGGYTKADGRVTLLIPIPDSADVVCTFIRNPEELKFSANCILK